MPIKDKCLHIVLCISKYYKKGPESQDWVPPIFQYFFLILGYCVFMTSNCPQIWIPHFQYFANFFPLILAYDFFFEQVGMPIF